MSDASLTGSIVCAFPSLRDAEFAVRALVELGHFNRDALSVVAGISRPDYQTEVDTYFVVLEGSPASVARARLFLQGTATQPSAEDAALREQAKQTALQIKMTRNLGGGL